MLRIFEKNISFSEKSTRLFCRLQSKILLHDRVFWQFSIRTQYICLYGKLSNVPKIAPSGKKVLWGPRRPNIRNFCYNYPWPTIFWGPHFFGPPPTPPICLKMPKCAIFGLFWSFHFKDALKVGVHREKFNIGNVAQIFFGDCYICWDYVISFSQHFPMRKFSYAAGLYKSAQNLVIW